MTWLDTSTNTEKIVERVEYDIYGKATFKNWGADRSFGTGDDATASTSLVGNPFLFTGQRYDPETGNYYYRSRYYSPLTGTFLSQDPLEYVNGPNMYQYCLSSPTNYSDPMGTDAEDFSEWDYFWNDFIRGKHKKFPPPPPPPESPKKEDKGAGKPSHELVRMYKAEAGAAYGATKAVFGGTFQFFYDGIGAVEYRLTGWDAYKDQYDDSVASGAGAIDMVAHPIDSAGRALDHAVDQYEAGDEFGAGDTFGSEAMSRYMAARSAAEAGRWALERARSLRASGGRPCVNPDDTCFVTGTLVLTASGFKPIEQLHVGERVIADDGENVEGLSAVSEATWRLIRLRMPNPEHPNDIIELELLRSVDWIEQFGCKAGAIMEFSLPEMELLGPATVLSVDPCPKIDVGIGRVILATVTHFNGHVLRITIDGQEQPLEPTRWHRIFSETRGDWVAANDLKIGDLLRTKTGIAKITAIAPKLGCHRVYNIEVESRHCYYVSGQEVLVHNAYTKGEAGGESCSKSARQSGVRDMWRQEIENIRNGKPSRKWSAKQKAAILKGDVPLSEVDGKSVEGAHVKSVAEYPELAADGNNVKPKSFTEHRKAGSGEHSKNPLPHDTGPTTTP